MKIMRIFKNLFGRKKESKPLSDEDAVAVVLSDVPFEVKMMAMQSAGMVPPDGYNPITGKVEDD